MCNQDGCKEKRFGHGMCSKHYTRWRRYGSPDVKNSTTPEMSDAERFALKGYIVDDSGCWIWQGTIGAGGYGVLKTQGGKPDKAHRVSYRIHVGDFPIGAHVMHSCDNPPCVNPDHLTIGTRSANMQDMWDKRRHPSTPRVIAEETRVAMRKRYQEVKNAAQVAREFKVSITHTHRIIREA